MKVNKKLAQFAIGLSMIFGIAATQMKFESGADKDRKSDAIENMITSSSEQHVDGASYVDASAIRKVLDEVVTRDIDVLKENNITIRMSHMGHLNPISNTGPGVASLVKFRDGSGGVLHLNADLLDSRLTSHHLSAMVQKVADIIRDGEFLPGGKYADSSELSTYWLKDTNSSGTSTLSYTMWDAIENSAPMEAAWNPRHVMNEKVINALLGNDGEEAVRMADIARQMSTKDQDVFLKNNVVLAYGKLDKGVEAQFSKIGTEGYGGAVFINENTSPQAALEAIDAMSYYIRTGAFKPGGVFEQCMSFEARAGKDEKTPDLGVKWEMADHITPEAPWNPKPTSLEQPVRTASGFNTSGPGSSFNR